ncbi:hypothetical protein I553_9056 [Mycobacterium xenopi 4042]|uniref:Uncharacterized protein n=1 Tax=Mycobacterium xenopi 4042 TaxID=1299334 RepID=X8ALW6_MYCXE|nr:hypothetical protein I553_9056 [Mycobacterium xenopi 4042]
MNGQGTLRAMWSAVLALGLLAGLDPMRFGITLLVISRSRPCKTF